MRPHPVTRREALREIVLAGAMVGFGCSVGQSQEARGHQSGRLTARPQAGSGAPQPGLTPLRLGDARDGLMYIPATLATGSSAPLVLLLHGAGGSARGITNRLTGAADETGCALLVPDSRGPTWDAIRGDFGPDVAFIDAALSQVFAKVSVDPGRVVVSGFSDGASYALALGLINGDLFRRVVAFSPGFVPPGSRPTGSPQIWITHGNADPILPYEVTSQRIVAELRRGKYDVTLKQFDGGHTVPPDLARDAFAWAASPAGRGG